MIASTTLVIYVLLTSSVLAAPVRRAVSATDILVFRAFLSLLTARNSY